MSRSQGHVGPRGDELPIRVFCTMIRPNPYRRSADIPRPISEFRFRNAFKSLRAGTVGAVCYESCNREGAPLQAEEGGGPRGCETDSHVANRSALHVVTWTEGPKRGYPRPGGRSRSWRLEAARRPARHVGWLKGVTTRARGESAPQGSDGAPGGLRAGVAPTGANLVIITWVCAILGEGRRWWISSPFLWYAFRRPLPSPMIR
jgi:hypothetical protein